MFGEQLNSSPDFHLCLELCAGRVCSPEMLNVVRCRMPAMAFAMLDGIDTEDFLTWYPRTDCSDFGSACAAL